VIGDRHGSVHQNGDLALSNRLENRADSVVNVMPACGGDMKAAAMLLRLLVQVADVQEVDGALIVSD
jgi:hypothetical protein